MWKHAFGIGVCRLAGKVYLRDMKDMVSNQQASVHRVSLWTVRGWRWFGGLTGEVLSKEWKVGSLMVGMQMSDHENERRDECVMNG